MYVLGQLVSIEFEVSWACVTRLKKCARQCELVRVKEHANFLASVHRCPRPSTKTKTIQQTIACQTERRTADKIHDLSHHEDKADTFVVDTDLFIPG